MRVLFLTQFYPPESGAPQNRLSDMARRLSDAGHEVEVLTAMPNYPKGVVFDGYQHRAVLEERRDGIRVVRTWVFASPSGGFVRRLLTYFSFVVSSLIFGARRVGRPDAVVVELPPLFLGLSGYAISRLRRAKLVLNVSDLWPESAVAMGILRNRISDQSVDSTRGVPVPTLRSRHWSDRGNRTERPVTISEEAPGTDHQRRRPGCLPWALARRTRVESSGGSSDLAKGFVVGYAGLHGHAQGLETVLRAAQLLENSSDVLFAFFGEGPLKADLIAFARGAMNVRFIAAQPSSRMREVLSTFDVAVIPLRRLALFRGALPSKMFEAMAAGVPLLVSIEGEARALVERSQAGVFVEPEDARGLAQAILTLRAGPRSLPKNGGKRTAARRRALRSRVDCEAVREVTTGNGRRRGSRRRAAKQRRGRGRPSRGLRRGPDLGSTFEDGEFMTVETKIACIGAGYWGRNLVRNFDALHALSWICEVDTAKHAELAAAYPRARVTDSMDQVLSDPRSAVWRSPPLQRRMGSWSAEPWWQARTYSSKSLCAFRSRRVKSSRASPRATGECSWLATCSGTTPPSCGSSA